MRNVTETRKKLRAEAGRISEQFGRAPVAIIVAGKADAGVRATVTEFANLGERREGRLRDKLGILEVAKQIESKRHLVGRDLERLSQRVAVLEGEEE